MKDFNIFGSNEEGEGMIAGLPEIMALISHHIEEHGMPPTEGIKILFDMINPGVTDNSTDVRPIWTGAMYAYGFPEVCVNFTQIYINTMPWGVGFCIAIEPEFSFHALSKEAQQAVIKSLAVVLNSGGLEATVGEDNTINIKMPRVHDDDEADEGTILSMDEIIGQFRTDLEGTDNLAAKAQEEDKPDDPNDPTNKWRPKR